MSITNNARIYFKLERKRAQLASENRMAELKKLYSKSVEIQNYNDSSFWDAKFDSVYEKRLINFMEADRNALAVTWLKERVSEDSFTLNIGSGDGNLERLISNLRIRHLGFDIAKKSLSRLRRSYPKFRFLRKDILSKVNLGYRAKFNAICMFEVLEHISPRNTFLALSHVYEMLRPDGIFLISVPMNEGLEEMFPYNPNEHLRCYTPDLIIKELEMSGFKVERFELFYAFSSFYRPKSILVKIFCPTWLKPNNILLLCKK